jgi:hypothetical protein
MFDVPKEQYPMVIREMIRHENEVTNHRIMWLLIGQGFIANAYFTSMSKGLAPSFMLSMVGIVITLSAFLMLYRTYQARGYLEFLGVQAKQGTLKEEHLPIKGWPRRRIKDWRRSVCVCPWFRQFSDLLEPWLLLPSIFLLMWLSIQLQQWTGLPQPICVVLGVTLTVVILSVCCMILVSSQRKTEDLDV